MLSMFIEFKTHYLYFGRYGPALSRSAQKSCRISQHIKLYVTVYVYIYIISEVLFESS